MKIKRLLNKLKYNAYNLKIKGQLPSKLFELICAFDDKTTEKEVRFLEDLSSHLLRVRGYYFKNKEINDKTNEEIVVLYEKFKKDNCMI